MRAPPKDLLDCLDACPPAIREVHLAVRERVLAAAPRAIELIYDAANAVSCAYSYSGRLKEAFVHVAAYRQHVNLGFNQGADLDDPLHLLRGSGVSIRHVRIERVEDLHRPGLTDLILAAEALGAARVDALPTSPTSTLAARSERRRR